MKGNLKTYDEKRVVCSLENTVFCECVLHFVFCNNHFFFQNFYGEEVTGAFFSAENDFAESAFAQHFDELKVFKRLRP